MKILFIFTLIFLYAGTFNVRADSIRDQLIERAKAVERRDAEARARAVLANRIEKVKTYLVQNRSPLASSADGIVRCADTYGLNPALLIGITRAESTYGLYYTLSNNPWNWNVHGGTTFRSIEDGACTVARGLKKNYDLTSTLTIGCRFAPDGDGNNCKHWATVVQEVIDKLKV